MAGQFNFVLTNKGASLLAKLQAGGTLNFTKVQIGDGQIGATDPKTLNALIAAKHQPAVSSVFYVAPNKAKVGTQFNNSNFASPFVWREIGLFATDPNEGEILYAYGNAGATAETIPASNTPVEKWYDIIAVAGNATTINATISPGSYITREEYARASKLYLSGTPEEYMQENDFILEEI
ncbi:MAG TPA: phage tail protein [Candidatus Nitrosocosmicus sp.]|nr:phage tail protein [Candidatus Nitrosocosmicus sp.]